MVFQSLSTPQEQVVHRNLRALVETAAIQQAESSASRHRLVASLPTRGVGTHQMNCSIRSPLQPPSTAQEVAAVPRPDLVPTPHRPHVRKWLGLNHDARSVMNTRRQAQQDTDLHRMVASAGGVGPSWPTEEYEETHPRHGS